MRYVGARARGTARARVTARARARVTARVGALLWREAVGERIGQIELE